MYYLKTTLLALAASTAPALVHSAPAQQHARRTFNTNSPHNSLLPLPFSTATPTSLLPLPFTTATPTAAPQALAFLDVDLVPNFGVEQGVNRDVKQIGSCDGFNGEELVLIPCFCPPNRDSFLQALNGAVGAGRFLDEAITFSNDVTDVSAETNKARATAMIIVLQSFNGTKGVGCPAASAPNLLSQQLSGVRLDGTFVA